MTVGRALRLGLATVVAVTAVARALEPLAGSAPTTEVRVLSLPGRPTVLTLQATPEAVIEDRTPGAHPPTDGQGVASVGETFSDEVTFVVRGAQSRRPATIDVADALVSTVKLFPERDGTQVVVFVRQPVTYAIARPTALGAVALTLRPRAVATKPAASPASGALARQSAQAGASGEDQVAVDAAELSYDQQANVLIARGGVTLTRGATTLRADEVRYDRTTSVAQANGHVVVVDPEATVEGDAASIDLDDETGFIDEAHADMKQSPYRLTADHIEKRGGPCYGVRNGVFTTCRCGGVEPPSWSIASADTDITLSGVGIAKDAKFRVQDVPVLYTPYLVFPANNDRQSGFLIPRVGFSNRLGFVYEQPFYWAIDKSSDATITTAIETSARVGVIGEYRYEWSRTARGVLLGGYFNERLGGEPPITTSAQGGTETPTNRWVVAGSQRAKPWDGGRFYIDGLRISDKFFLREIHAFTSNVRGEVQVRSQRLTRSTIGLVQTWEGGGAQASATAYQDLIDPQEFALNELPRIDAQHALPLFDGLAVGRLAGETVDFQREQGFGGVRFDLGPEVFVPMHLGRYVHGSVSGQFRETAYQLTDREQVGVFVPDNPDFTNSFEAGRRYPRVAHLDSSHTREVAEVQGRLGTDVSRVYDLPFLGLSKLRHSIEPEVQYLYIPPVPTNYGAASSVRRDGQPGTFFTEGYLFDEVDAIRHRNFFSYGVTSRVLARGAAPYDPVAPGAAEVPVEDLTTPATDAGDDDDGDVDLEGDEGDEDVEPDSIPQGLPLDAIPAIGSTRASSHASAAGVPASRELLRMSLLQGYDISREISGSSHFSSVDAQVRVTPVDWAGISAATSLDVNNGRTVARTFGAILRDPTWAPPSDRPSFQSPSSLGVAYRFISQGSSSPGTSTLEQRLLGRDEAVEGVDGAVYLRLTDYIGIGFVARYQLSDTQVRETNNANKIRTLGPRFLERDYFMRWISRCNCWVLEAGVSDRADTNNTTFRVQFTLYGLGSFGQSPLRQGTAALAGLQALGLRRPRAVGGYE